MDEDQKASTIIPASPQQEALAKIDNRDKLVRAVEITILLFVVAFNIFLGLRIQSVIDQNQRDAKARSEAAQQDRNEQKDYIKCVLLIKFDDPPADLTTKVGTSKALDACAKQSAARE